MKITIDEIKNILNDLIEENISREEAANWAVRRQLAFDAYDLEFEPKSEENRIWDSIIYLIGVDLLNYEGGNLHSIEDFIDFKKKMDL